jgi:hypothetical protein
MLLAYQGWAGAVGGQAYNVDRIWGKMNPNPAIAEVTKPKQRMSNGGATIVRWVLFLAGASSPELQAASLLDVSGRRVLELHAGANDVSKAAPGVYFVRETSSMMRSASSVTKVVITR